MGMKNSRQKDIVSGSFWSINGQIGALVITLLANLVYARILSPGEFGQLGIVLFFIFIARVFVESGLGGALIRNNKATEIDYSTIFVFNLSVSLILVIIINFSSGFIAEFYNDTELERLINISSIILILNSFQFIQNTRLVKELRFKQKAIYETSALLIGAIVGILSALKGLGVWSMILMQLINTFTLTLILWIFEGVNIRLVFDKNSFVYHYKFGVNTTLISIISTIFKNVYHLILGKYFSLDQTGFFYQAKKLEEIPTGVLNRLTQNVVFSSLSRIQDEKGDFKEIFNKVTRIFIVILAFICMNLFVFASEIITVVLGEKWADSSLFLKFLAVASFFNMLEMFNRVLFKVYNHTRDIVYLEIFKKAVQIISIVLGVYFKNISLLMYGVVASNILGYLVNIKLVELNYSFLGNKVKSVVFKVILIVSCIIMLTEYLDFDNTLKRALLKLSITTLIFILSIKILGLVNLKKLLLIKKNYD